MRRTLSIACLSLCFLSLPAAQAALLIADFGDIATGQLSGKAGGTGWTGNWTGSTTPSVVSSNLSSTRYTVVQSGTAQHIVGANTGGLRQNFRTPTLSLSGEIWFSYLAQNTVSTNGSGLSFNAPTGTPFDNPGSAFLQFVGTSLVYRFGDASNQTITGQTTLGATSLVVGRLVINGGGANDTVQIWVNPDLVATPNINLLTPVVSSSAFNFADSLSTIGAILHNNGGTGTQNAHLDALRISDGSGNAATAYYDVTNVPEPSTWALLATAALVLFLTKHRGLKLRCKR